MRFARFSLRRALAVFAAVLVVGATVIPQDADARAGRSGSFGSRGSKTFNAPPPTATSPGAAPMQRSITQPGQPGGVGAPSAASRAGNQGGMFGGRFGGFGAGLMGGLLGAGLFGLLAGNGFFGGLGSMASILGLLIQVGLIIIVARLIMNWMRRRQEPQTAAAGASPYGMGSGGIGQGGMGQGAMGASRDRVDDQSGGRSSYGLGGGYAAGHSAASSDLSLEPSDFDDFERMLTDVQDAWSRQDLSRLRGLATPEMVEMFGEDLAEDASRGVVNKVSGVKLLQGDLAESWSEQGRDYATVAMRYELVDVTEDRATGRVVDGDPHAREEAVELWTFVRSRNGGRWLLSAIQQQG